MKKIVCFLFTFFAFCGYSQLQDVKVIIPKDQGFSYYDFVQFFDHDNYFVVSGNALTIYNTETAEVLDEVDLAYGAKNLSISADGKYILVTANNELFIYTFVNQKLKLYYKTNSEQLINNLPNAQYYKSLPISGAFFTAQSKQVYVSIGSFTLLYDTEKNLAVSSNTFELTEYILSSVYYPKHNSVLLAVTSGTNSYIKEQSLNDLAKVEKFNLSPSTITKLKLRDSLLMCFTSHNYFIYNVDKKRIEHEVKVPKYENYGYYSSEVYNDINKRPVLSTPDTINFSKDEYVYDMDYLSKEKMYVYATAKGIKFINSQTKKLASSYSGVSTNVKLTQDGNRAVVVGYQPYKSLRVYEPSSMKLVAEKVTMGSTINSANVSPNNKWLFTNGGTTGFFWDLSNFTKYVQLKDVSGSDSAFIYNVYFLNDSEVVVNSGKSMASMNLSLYNINRKKYTKTIKQKTFALASGFKNGEFYYCDYTSLHILNLKSKQEEVYKGLFSMAASPMYKVVEFNKDLVFIPESGKFQIMNRKTKKVVYENTSWGFNSKVIIADNGKSIYTTAQITKNKTINGVNIDMPINSIVKIDLETKNVLASYAETYLPYDFKLSDDGKQISCWYVKYDVANPSQEQLTTYTIYNEDNGAEVKSVTLASTSTYLPYSYLSESGKYFALSSVYGDFFKIYDDNGSEIIDLSSKNYFASKCFFNEKAKQVMIVSSNNSAVTFVDLAKKQVIGQLANAIGDHFFLMTSDLNYLGSKEFIKNIRFKYQSEIYSFEQFDVYLNQPHKVLKAFGCSDTALITAYEKAYLKRMKVLGLKPDVKPIFSNLPSIPTVVLKDLQNGKVQFNLIANKGQNKLSKLRIENNGNVVLQEIIEEGSGDLFTKNFVFETVSGINRFAFTVTDDKGVESPQVIRFYNNTNTTKPNLYLVVVASEKFKDTDYDLTYATKDANDIANTMLNSKAFNKIEIKKLFNRSFTTDSVKALKHFFEKAGINDVVMFFYAGHGYLDEDLSYYFPTYYTDFTDPKINSVAYNSIETILSNIKPLKKIMFIDACFSGEADDEISVPDNNESKSGKKDSTRAIRIAGSNFAQSTALELSKSIFSDLRKNSGVTVIASAGGAETAFESEAYNNGLFTYCLINALKNTKADENKDGKITLTELQKFVAEEVNRLSDGQQTPTYRAENNVLDYTLWE